MEKMLCLLFNLLLASYLWEISIAYKPVVLIHGILSGADSMMILQQEIELQHPGTKVYNCDLYSNWFSLENAWKQIKELGKYLREIGEKHSKEGIIVIGYSQGGLLARATIQTLLKHNVRIFISLSSPQAGQYGTEFLHLIFPDLTAKDVYELFYSRIGQLTSVANYWNDPHKQELYHEYNVFLPYINNELESENSTQFRNNLLQLDRMVLIGGPDDGVITPWQSSHFAYFNSSLDVVELNKRVIYRKDKIGLRTLAERGKLEIIAKPFVQHHRWHHDRNLIREIIIPYLI